MTPSASGAPDGRVALAWPGMNDAGNVTGIRLAVRGPGAGGTFGAVEPVADGPADDAVVAMGSAGDVAVAWTGYGGGVFVRRRGPDGALGASETLIAPPQSLTTPPAIAVDDAGNTVVAWIGGDGAIVTRWAHAGQPFGAPQPFADDPHALSLSLAITGTGRALVGYSSGTSAPATSTAFLVPIQLDAASGAPHQLAAGAVPAGALESAPVLAVSRGGVLAAWTRSEGAYLGSPTQLFTAPVSADGTAGASHLVYAGRIVTGVHASLGPQRAVVGWDDLVTGAVGGATGDDAASVGGAFTAASGEGEFNEISTGVDTDGNAVLIWSHQTGGGSETVRGTNEIRTVTIPRGRTTPCAATAIAQGTFGRPALLMDGAGGGLAVWSEHVNGSIMVATWRAAGTTCPAASRGTPAAAPVALVGTRVTVRVARHTIVRLKVRCQAAAGCRGPATLTAGALTLGTGRIKVASGKRATLVLRPRTSKARKRLRRRGSFAAKLGLKLARPGSASMHTSLGVRLRVRR